MQYKWATEYGEKSGATVTAAPPDAGTAIVTPCSPLLHVAHKFRNNAHCNATNNTQCTLSLKMNVEITLSTHQDACRSPSTGPCERVRDAGDAAATARPALAGARDFAGDFAAGDFGAGDFAGAAAVLAGDLAALAGDLDAAAEAARGDFAVADARPVALRGAGDGERER